MTFSILLVIAFILAPELLISLTEISTLTHMDAPTINSTDGQWCLNEANELVWVPVIAPSFEEQLPASSSAQTQYYYGEQGPSSLNTYPPESSFPPHYAEHDYDRTAADHTSHTPAPYNTQQVNSVLSTPSYQNEGSFKNAPQSFYGRVSFRSYPFQPHGHRFGQFTLRNTAMVSF
jgi:hypothetical protein